MVFVFPASSGFLESRELSLPAQFVGSGLDKKAAAAPSADEYVDLLDQFFRKNYMCPYYAHDSGPNIAH
jgi:hypothetical protein